jgi:hypothetical protein
VRPDNPRIALSPVVAVARDQPHAVAVALQPQPVAVVLPFMEPVRAVRDDGGLGGDAERKGLKKAAYIGAFKRNCEFQGWAGCSRRPSEGTTSLRTAAVQAGISSSHATTATNTTKLIAAATKKLRSILSMESPLHYSDRIAACAFDRAPPYQMIL